MASKSTNRSKRNGKAASAGPLPSVHRDAAGIDVGSEVHYVAVNPERCDIPIRHFGCFTDELEALAQWLHECKVTVVALEATGVYGVALCDVLEAHGFDVRVVDARSAKRPSRKKSDVLDCEWLRELMRLDVLRNAFRPQAEIRELRAYVRQRARHIDQRADTIRRMQKALAEMNIQLANVISDITGKTGMAIIRDIVAGERDPQRLARHRDPRIKRDHKTLARSLHGHWRREHLFDLRQQLALFDAYGDSIEQCEREIVAFGARLAGEMPSSDSYGGSVRARQDRLARVAEQVLGVDLGTIPLIGTDTALTVAAELGPGLSSFETCGHLASWAGLAPSTRISGGRRLGGRAPRVFNLLGQQLRQCAVNGRHSRTYLGAQHRALLRRTDAPRAIKATAHRLLRIIWSMLTNGQAYVERGVDVFEAEREQRKLGFLRRSARKAGFELVAVSQ